MESSLWNLRCGIFVVECLVVDSFFGIFCSGIFYGGIFVVESSLWNLSCGTFVVGSSFLNSWCADLSCLLVFEY